MTPNEKKFVEDLQKNGKVHDWATYADKYFPGKSSDYVRKLAGRLGIRIKPANIKPPKRVWVPDNSTPQITQQEQAFLDRLRKEGVWGSYAQMAKDAFGSVDGEVVKRVMARWNYSVKERPATPQTQIEDRRASAEMETLRDQIRSLAYEISQKDEALKIFQNIGSYDLKKINIPEPSNKKTHEAVMISQWGDWHSDEIVIPAHVNGVNEYNPKIFKERVKKMVANMIKVLNTQRSSIDVKEGIIHLAGDFITGWIHPEGEQSNAFSPVDAIIEVLQVLVSAIDYVLEHGSFDKLRLICSRGNHGRLSKRMQSNDHEVNLEKIIYFHLSSHYRDNDKVLVIAGDSPLQYISVYGKNIRFFHGHQIKYLGGIGGMTVPLYKAILRWDANYPAYYNFMGDKHTYCQPTPNCQVNGSLIGMNSYGMENGFTFQPPLQSFTLLDSKLGVTIKAPVFCD